VIEPEDVADFAGTVVPFYLLVDASGSTKRRGWLKLFHLALPAFVRTLEELETTELMPRMSIISYGTDVSVRLALTAPSDLDRLPQFVSAGVSSLATGLSELRQVIDSDAIQLEVDGLAARRPTVVLVADGLPTDPPEALLVARAGVEALGPRTPCVHCVHPAGTDLISLAGLGVLRSIPVPTQPTTSDMEQALVEATRCTQGCRASDPREQVSPSPVD
jgi:hypothetical protein